MAVCGLDGQDWSTDRGQLKVIKCSNLQSALDILNQLFQSLCSMSVKTTRERVATTERRVCACVCARFLRACNTVCAVWSIIYLSLPKEEIVYKYHPVELSVGATKGYPQSPHCSLASLLVWPPSCSAMVSGVCVCVCVCVCAPCDGAGTDMGNDLLDSRMLPFILERWVQ